MATATTTTTVAIAAAAAVNKIIKRSSSSLTLGVNNSTRINLTHNPRFIIKTLPTATTPFRQRHNKRFRCFCTAAEANVNVNVNVNVNAEEEPTKVSSSSSDSDQSKKSDSGPSVIDSVKMLNIRVGKIIKAWRHEEADSLYVEEVDVGEVEPRVICSGLVKYIPLDYLQGRKVVVLANLKPRNMRGVKSNGMLMAASDASHENVELLEPPMDSIPGERIWFGSEDDKDNQPGPASPNQVQKKKIWESVQPHLKTDDSCKAMIGEHLMRTSAGVVVCRSLKNANIS